MIAAHANASRPPRAQTLPELAVGCAGVVVGVDVPGEAGERLLEMGLTPGVAVRLVRRGFFGDPLVLETRGCQLSLRRVEAAAISIIAE